ncbi:hypothetical protein [Krasilnikovia sp. MM14-A1004]|uniref:LppU/SCO3897 family protein n=1 Tax=Krasilnikovia sp. MM14-A1004 TaxID=3373541 RepID=UPI00399CA005
MTQNGPYSGRPWPAGGSPGSDEPYTEPADPWGEHPTAAAPEGGWGAHPVSGPTPTGSSPGYPQPYPPAPTGAPGGWTPPVEPQPRRRNGPIVALVVVLGLLICGGLATTAWLITRDTDKKSQSGALATPSAPTTGGVEPRSSEDARFVTKGQCVRNEGTTDSPIMKITPCASGTYEVLKRVDGRTSGEDDAKVKCSKVPHYTKWYFYDSELDSLDFVLCLRER